MAPIPFVVGDFNGDGIPDVAGSNVYLGSAIVLLGNGDGTFIYGPQMLAGSSADVVAVGDFNGDGRDDLAMAAYGQYHLADVLQEALTVLLSQSSSASTTITGISLQGAGTHLVEAKYIGTVTTVLAPPALSD
jgi:hypothetical protein